VFNLEKLKSGILHKKHSVQTATQEKYQNLLENQLKPVLRWFVVEISQTCADF
jgi:hypothetical protein